MLEIKKTRLSQLATATRRTAQRAIHRPVLLHDDFLDWLGLAISGMQHPGNLYLFDLAVRNAPEAPMLEIGSFCGLSTNIIQYLKRKHGRTMPLFTCDKWIFEGSENPLPPAAGVSHGELRAYVKESFEQSARSFSADELPISIEATSDELFAAWIEDRETRDIFDRPARLGGPLGFCFIDGNHTEEYALRDFQHCDQFLVSGGLILFDDSNDESDWEVKKVIERIKADSRYEIVAKNPNYLVRKR